MLAFTLRRLLSAIPTLLIVLTVVFVMVRIAPGDPARAVLGDYASQDAVTALRTRMGLDVPLWRQYLDYLAGLASGNFGKSLINGSPIGAQLARAVPYTLELTFAGILMGLLLGVPTGIYTALNRNKLPDYIGRVLSLLGVSFPSFYLGILLMLVFSVWLDWLPAVGGGDLSDPASNLRHLILPATTLGLVMTSYVTRLSRSVFLDVSSEDFVRTARSKGIAERTVIFKHMLRNALIPIISIAGIYAIVLTGGALVVEVVFSRPGLGRLIVGAMLQRDYITVQSVIVVYALFVLLINLLTDLGFALADPRIRYD